MRKRAGHPIIVEIRCGANNGACGTRVLDTGVVLTPEGPRLFTPHVAPLSLLPPGAVQRKRAENTGARIPRRFTPEDRAGEPLSLQTRPSFVTCPVEGHGRGLVTGDALLEAVKEFKKTGKVATATFVPAERSGHVWVGDNLIELDADWWDQQDQDTRERWWVSRGGELPR